MKRLFCLFTFLITLSCFAQQKASGDEIINIRIETLVSLTYSTSLRDSYEGVDEKKKEYAKEILVNIWTEILKNCDELITYYPESEYYFSILFEKAITEESLENFSVAKEFYKKVLSFETSETGIKNNSLRHLASISIKEKKYKDALNYLDQTKNFEIVHLCGVGEEAYKETMEMLYKMCYEGLNKKQ